MPNRIGFNARGIAVASVAGTGNQVWGNEFIGNVGLGIELGNFGVTANDADDADAGGNAGQNFPVLGAIELAPDGFQVDGTLDVPAASSNASYLVALYESASCDGSGNGEGSTLLFAAGATLSGNDEEFSILAKSAPPTVGSVVTATATDAAGNTSEFSNCLIVVPANALFSDGYEDQE
jgi:hypothetical protein